MPKLIADFIKSRLADTDFLPEGTLEDRQASAQSLADKLYGEGYLVSSDFGLEFTQVESQAEFTLEATETGEVLRFKNAILCRTEVNRNKDEITHSNIEELSASIVGRPIDLDHRLDKNVGIITEAASRKDGTDSVLVIGGILWRDRAPLEVDGIRKGTHHLSVEALAEFALCSKCNGEFGDSEHYCSHLKARKAGNTKRGFKNLSGKGAGITRNPAGSATTFDRNQIFVVASHTEESEMSCPHCGKEATGDTCGSCNKSTVPSVIASELKTATESLNALKAQTDQEKVALTTEKTELENKLTAATTALEAEKTKVKEAKDARRLDILTPLLPKEKLEERKPALLSMEDEAFNVFVASVQEASTDTRKINLGAGVRMPDPKPKNDGAKVSLR